ncbi:MAG: DUF3748 domain-containing protein [Planctomycetes bacterium]|nr:DUF3748 domain-containing protein [Planctomycetota bacterium]
MKCLELVLVLGMSINMTEMADGTERQITSDVAYDHELDSNDNFSPDDRFLVFDTRTPDGGIAASRMVGKVEITTGEITPLYKAKQPNSFGPGAGAASFSHRRDEVIFIHGPFRPTGPENQYEQYRRVGVIAAGDGSGEYHLADARNTVAPFSVGALRGGTHRHEFSGDGDWVGFTYNDAVLESYGHVLGKKLNLRTIGVTHLGHSVSVPAGRQFSGDADGFSVLVVTVVPRPKPGSDEISHAAQDSWIGRNGYLRADGTRQMGRAFIGTTRNAQGEEVDELFVVDIPSNITRPGPLGPLEGTEKTYPAPPAGTVQRRLTNSSQRRYPGCKGIVRASHDGSQIAFLMLDDQEKWQVFLISPLGGEPRQATFLEGGVDAGVRWHPNGNTIVAVADTRIVLTMVEPGSQFGKSWVLSDRAPAPFALVWSHDGNTIAYNRRVESAGSKTTQIFVCDFHERD